MLFIPEDLATVMLRTAEVVATAAVANNGGGNRGRGRGYP